MQDKNALLTALDDSSDGGQRPLAGKARKTEGLNVRKESRPVFQLQDWKHISQLHNTNAPHPNPFQTLTLIKHTHGKSTHVPKFVTKQSQKSAMLLL